MKLVEGFVSRRQWLKLPGKQELHTRSGREGSSLKPQVNVARFGVSSELLSWLEFINSKSSLLALQPTSMIYDLVSSGLQPSAGLAHAAYHKDT